MTHPIPRPFSPDELATSAQLRAAVEKLRTDVARAIGIDLTHFPDVGLAELGATLVGLEPALSPPLVIASEALPALMKRIEQVAADLARARQPVIDRTDPVQLAGAALWRARSARAKAGQLRSLAQDGPASRGQVFLLLGDVCASGLPAPREVRFTSGWLHLRFDSAVDLEPWVVEMGVGRRREQPYPEEEPEVWLTHVSRSDGGWHGWSVDLAASDPITAEQAAKASGGVR